MNYDTVINQTTISEITYPKIESIVRALKHSNIYKKREIIELYYREHCNNERYMGVAEYNSYVLGYVTLKIKSSYKFFLEAKIPEIVDLLVLPRYRNIGIGSKLLKYIESKAKMVSEIIGLGVGLERESGKAQQFYYHKGYIPDGRGISLISSTNNIEKEQQPLLRMTKKL